MYQKPYYLSIFLLMSSNIKRDSPVTPRLRAPPEAASPRLGRRGIHPQPRYHRTVNFNTTLEKKGNRERKANELSQKFYYRQRTVCKGPYWREKQHGKKFVLSLACICCGTEGRKFDHLKV